MVVFFRHYDPAPSGPVTVCNNICKALTLSPDQCVNISLRGKSMAAVLARFLALSCLIQSRPSSAIYVLSGSPLGHKKDIFILCVARLLFIKKFILVCVGNYESENQLLNLLKKFIFYFAHVVVHERENSFSRGSATHVVIPNPVNVSSVPYQKKHRKMQHQQTLKIGFYSNLIKGKGFLSYLKFCDEVSEQSDVMAMVIGRCMPNRSSWYTKNEIQNLLSRSNVVSYQHEACLDADHAVYSLSSCAFVYFGSYYKHENLPLTLLDCMANKIPIVLNDGNRLIDVVPTNTFVLSSVLIEGLKSGTSQISKSLDMASNTAFEWVNRDHSWEEFEKSWKFLVDHLKSDRV